MAQSNLIKSSFYKDASALKTNKAKVMGSCDRCEVISVIHKVQLHFFTVCKRHHHRDSKARNRAERKVQHDDVNITQLIQDSIYATVLLD